MLKFFCAHFLLPFFLWLAFALCSVVVHILIAWFAINLKICKLLQFSVCVCVCVPTRNQGIGQENRVNRKKSLHIFIHTKRNEKLRKKRDQTEIACNFSVPC